MQTLSETQLNTGHDAWIELRIDRLLSNLSALKSAAGTHAGVLAVIKANAYGHGLLEIGKALDGKVSHLGVASVPDALLLKEALRHSEIFLFGRAPENTYSKILSNPFTLTVSSREEALSLSQAAGKAGRRLKIHLKIDTGMGRLGIPFRLAIPAIEEIHNLPGLVLDGIYTHFPAAESMDSFTERQERDFCLLTEALDRKGIRFRFRHAANSGGILKQRSSILNLCRPGILLYGAFPHVSAKERISVAPVLSLKSRFILIKKLQPGDSSGYGRTFIAEKQTSIGILPFGYSQGYPFSASGKTSVLYRGKRYPVAGRISMDYMAVNLGTDLAAAEDPVTLIGSDGNEKITAEDIASWAQTIPYEIITRLSPLIPRTVLH